MFFSLGSYIVPRDIVLLLHLLPLSQVAYCGTTRAVSWLTLKRYVRACKK